ISGVMNFGMFVELPNTIEGLVHVNNLTDDFYNFNERMMAMLGESTGKVFRIGDTVEIEVKDVNLDERLIDFKVVGMPESKRDEQQRNKKPVNIKAKTRSRSHRDKVNESRGKKPKSKKPFYKAAPKGKGKKKRK